MRLLAAGGAALVLSALVADWLSPGAGLTKALVFGSARLELVAEVQEECFWHLRAPVERVTGWDTPYPHAFEWEYFPSRERISDALVRAVACD